MFSHTGSRLIFKNNTHAFKSVLNLTKNNLFNSFSTENQRIFFTKPVLVTFHNPRGFEDGASRNSIRKLHKKIELAEAKVLKRVSERESCRAISNTTTYGEITSNLKSGKAGNKKSDKATTSDVLLKNGGGVAGIKVATQNESTFLVKLRPYYRLARMDKPIGSSLLFWPCSWSLAYAYHYFQTTILTTEYTMYNLELATVLQSLTPVVLLKYTALCAVGAVIMRGAGCIINDMCDVKFDKYVERTRSSRPLASGEATRLQAFGLLTVMMSAGFFGVLIHLNPFCILLGFLSIPLIVIYPLMKRITYWPQMFLGITFNYGIPMGWAMISGNYPPSLSSPAAVVNTTTVATNLSLPAATSVDVSPPLNEGILNSGLFTNGNIYDLAEKISTSITTILSNGDIAFGGGNFNLSIILPLYASTILWTLVYDTIYAHQDKLDDIKVGVKSTALLFGDRYTKPILYTLSAFVILLLGYSGYQNSFGSMYFMGLFTAGPYMLYETIKNVDLASPKSCWKAFMKSNRFGALVLLLIFAGYY